MAAYYAVGASAGEVAYVDRLPDKTFGARSLMDVVLFFWHERGAFNLGIYNRRRIRLSTAWSVHAVGRALDIGIPVENRPQLGDEICWALVAHHEQLGIQRIIWNGWNYTVNRPRSRAIKLPHRDHLHVELHPLAARGPLLGMPQGITTERVARVLLNQT